MSKEFETKVTKDINNLKNKIDLNFKKISELRTDFDSYSNKKFILDKSFIEYKKKMKKLIDSIIRQNRNDIGALMENNTDKIDLVVEGFKTESNRITREFIEKYNNHEARITILETK